MLALTRDDVRQLVPMPDAIALMKTAFIELSSGRTTSPLRTVIHVAQPPGDSLYMPAFVPAMNALGLKIVSVFPENRARGLPTINALVCLVNPETGAPMAVMDGTYLTALRTGAVSGAATDLLARDDSRTLVAIGAGVQGATQIAAVCAVRPIQRIVAMDVSPDALARFESAFKRDWPALAGRLDITTDSGVVAEADIVCTATTARTPVFDDANIMPGTHINAVGAYTPEMQEIPAATVARASVVVDAVDAVLAEAGDLIIPLREGLIQPEQISRELGMVAAGTAPGRTNRAEITLFKSVGNAIQDVAVARRAVDRARERGVGTPVNLE